MNNSGIIFIGASLICAVVIAYFDLRRRRIRLSQASGLSPLVWLDIAAAAATLSLGFWSDPANLLAPTAGAPQIAVALAISIGVFIFLWGEGRRANQFQRPNGIVLGELLVLAGFARIVLRLIAGEHPLFDAFNIGCIASGALVLIWVVPRFTKKREEHHIIERVSQIGEVQQPEYTPATEECLHPERWTMMDSMSAEVEVLEFLKQIVLTLKPALIVETGTFIAASTIKMAEGLRENGSGKIITCEFDPLVYAKAKERVAASGLQDWIECRNQSSLDMQIDGTIDLFFSDSHLPIREDEIRRFLPQINPNGLILMHDTSSHYKIAREAAFRLEQEGLISMVVLPTPRGLMMAQKRSGRK
jgi:predicted O-methyltransferase YrrM